MGADHRIVPAIKQALSMLRQAREALLFAQCPAAVAKVRRAIKSAEGPLRTAKRCVQPSQVVRSGAHPMARGCSLWQNVAVLPHAFQNLPQRKSRRARID
jgi:hypothetical protein